MYVHNNQLTKHLFDEIPNFVDISFSFFLYLNRIRNEFLMIHNQSRRE